MRQFAFGRLFALLLAHGLLSACATSEAPTNPPGSGPVIKPASNPACPDLARWSARQLHGTWEIALPDLGQSGELVLSQHPEFPASLRGQLRYEGHPSIASGDLEDGELNLDESRDGKTLFAFWTGHLVPASCGREIRGRWEQLPQAGSPARESRFVLRRMRTGSQW